MTFNQAICDRRHRIIQWLLGLIASLFVLFVGAAAWSTGIGYRVDRELQVHEAVKKEQEKSLNITLQRIQKDISSINSKVDNLLQKRYGVDDPPRTK